MGELFEELAEFWQESDLAAVVELRFIDVFEDDLKGYDTAHAMFKNGYALPLVAVDGIVRFYGGLSHSRLYDEVRKILQI